MKRPISEEADRAIAEQRAERRRTRHYAHARCPGCGCTPARFCTIELPDGAGLAACAPAGDVPGHACCSACLTPELRRPTGRWYMPDAETLAELVRLGFASPAPEGVMSTPPPGT